MRQAILTSFADLHEFQRTCQRWCPDEIPGGEGISEAHLRLADVIRDPNDALVMFRLACGIAYGRHGIGDLSQWKLLYDRLRDLGAQDTDDLGWCERPSWNCDSRQFTNASEAADQLWQEVADQLRTADDRDLAWVELLLGALCVDFFAWRRRYLHRVAV